MLMHSLFVISIICPCSSTSMLSRTLPIRILGPCKSASMAMFRLCISFIFRTLLKPSRCTSWLPWLMLKRNTSSPLRTISSITFISAHDGPQVATIFVLLTLTFIMFCSAIVGLAENVLWLIIGWQVFLPCTPGARVF